MFELIGLGFMVVCLVGIIVALVVQGLSGN
jgi:hypothetical protein